MLTPFLAYLPAEQLDVSGVVAVVSCGLALSQTTPRVVGARTRTQAVAFWRLATYLLNAALFVLVGLQLPVVLAAPSTDPHWHWRCALSSPPLSSPPGWAGPTPFPT